MMASTDELISSQATQAKHELIFVHDDGSAIQVFTEAGGINNRPKLMRKLKNHGAAICNDPTTAELIIVNQDTSQGRHFIRNWGTDDSKVVLHELWVRRCIEAGQALLQDHQWGDCIARDNGSFSEEEEDDMPQKSPLPTPRETPSEKRGTPLATTDAIPLVPTRQIQPQDPNVMPPALTSEPTPSISTNGSMQNPSLTPYSLMNAMPPFMQFPSQMASMFNGATPQQMMAASTMPQQLMSNLMAQQMMANMSMMMQSSGMPFNPESFSVAVADAISKYASGSQPTFSQPTRSESPDPAPALPYPDVPVRSSDKGSSRKSSWSNPVSLVRQRSLSQSSDTPSTQISAVKKGKDRAATPSPKRRKISTGSYPHASGSNGVASQKKVFQTKSGQELAFFVQIDMYNRFNLVDAIKKNGGRIEKEQELADYAVLYSGHKQQKAFKGLLASAQMAGKIAIPSRYIYDCIEQGSLLDPSEYEFGVISKTPRKSRPSTLKAKAGSESNDDDEAAKEAERKRLKKNQREAERREAIKRRKEDEKANLPQKRKKDAETPAEKISASKADTGDVSKPLGRGTPTPPPEHTREPWGNGYKFSLAENQFAMAYAELLVTRDHSVSLNSVCSAIHKKLPHHTLGSWRTQCNRIMSTEFETWRKRSSIAFRKALRESQTAPPTSAPPTPIIPAREHVTPTIQPPVTPQNAVDSRSKAAARKDSSTIFQDDLNVISRYFVQADEHETEESLWTRLAATHRCHTSSTWEDFYREYYEDVQKRHAEFVEEMGITQ